MSGNLNKDFGVLITRLIRKEHLSRDQAKAAFTCILKNKVTEMQQGAFLAALAAKGETEAEVAGSWEAIYDLDTTKVTIGGGMAAVENSGTGMDTFKTFNISTAAAVVAAAGGIPMARHGARAITSTCGTVDMAEALGVDVECPAHVVARSIETAGVGLFNGMSPHIHPMALGRILSQIHFGSTLNIAASLANPALPSIGVRGVYSKAMLFPVARVMKAIGYKRAIILHGTIDHSTRSMDEASICGVTHCVRISAKDGFDEFNIDPHQLGLASRDYRDLSPRANIQGEAKRLVALLRNTENGARKDALILNAGLIFLAANRVSGLRDGIERASVILESGAAFKTLEKWVASQNMAPEKGLHKLHRLVA